MDNKKNTVLLTGIAVATLLVAVVGATFAYFSATITNVNNTETVLKAANLGITFTGTKEIPSTGTEQIINPGWTDTKTFTVENTSDYDMTFNIVFHDTTNEFTRKQDLTYSVTGEFVSGGTGAVQVIDPTATDQSVAGNNKIAMSVSGAQLPSTGAPNTNAVAKVYIPKKSKQSFTMTFNYADAKDAQNNPIDQNDDQGKTFQTTVDIEALGIDPGQLNN